MKHGTDPLICNGNEAKRICTEKEGGGETDKGIKKTTIYVDVIIPVHNAATTIEETVSSVYTQKIPGHLLSRFSSCTIDVCVCCYDDGSTDESLTLLRHMPKSSVEENKEVPNITAYLKIGYASDGLSRGAGYARNMAASLRPEIKDTTIKNNDELFHFICLLDSDDYMTKFRIAEQVAYFLSLPSKILRDKTLLGTTFRRDPPDSTWHYCKWANQLSDERLHLEKFRECTVLQPTWMLTKSRFESIGGYIEAPILSSDVSFYSSLESKPSSSYKLIHPTFDTPQTLRLAEDLRFFHAHLLHMTSSVDKNDNEKGNSSEVLKEGGVLRLVRTQEPLVIYRHREGMSQSASTPRKLLLQLRVKAFEDTILKPINHQTTGRSEGTCWDKFVIWGAGRDGTDFFKALSPCLRKNVLCFVDVDWKKILKNKFYVNHQMDKNIKVPILHFSELSDDVDLKRRWDDDKKEWLDRQHDTNNKKTSKGEQKSKKGKLPHGKITKSKTGASFSCTKSVAESSKKYNGSNHHDVLKTKILDGVRLSQAPVVVCVAMYRTNGVLEKNVSTIKRTEGHNLWHFS